MKFDKIINSNVLKMPFNQENEKMTFVDYVTIKFGEYIELLSELDSDDIENLKTKTTKDVIINNQTKFIKGLNETILLYYDGYPEAAYKLLKKTLEDRIQKYKNLLNIGTYKEFTDFYRIRKLNDNNHLKPESFFHIPFELRGKVSNQRFSIPGFPSLYIGKTVYICWEELLRPNINEFYSVRLRSQSAIKYIDLAPPYLETNLYLSRYYKYLMTWPLIFLCSIRVKNTDDVFKPEYIVPQLLLQWVRENKNIDGIRYWSTHVDQDPTNFNGEFYNIVLPVKDNKNYGLCDSLCKKFQITEIVSWQLHEFALGGFNAINLTNNPQDKIIDSKMEYLELISGMKYKYSYSVFGKIEKYLSVLNLKKINNE